MMDTTAAKNNDAAAAADNPDAAVAPDAAALAKEAADLKDKLLRTLADMENLRRRTEREVADARAYATWDRRLKAWARGAVFMCDDFGLRELRLPRTTTLCEVITQRAGKP